MSFDLRSCTLSGEKQNVHMFSQMCKRGNWKNIKKNASEAYQEPCQTSMMEQLTIFAETLRHRFFDRVRNMRRRLYKILKSILNELVRKC